MQNMKNDLTTILIKPLVTEKSYHGTQAGKYSFKVAISANKVLVRKAVEKVYGVKVADVNISRVRGKIKTSGKIIGRTSNWKKAVVTLRKGETIPEAK